jgi:hypothetical protein
MELLRVECLRVLAEEEVLMVAIWVGVEEDGWWGRSLRLFLFLFGKRMR